MDSQYFNQAARRAYHLCQLVGRRAGEVGLLDGVITAVRHQGQVDRVHLEVFDADPPRGPQGPAISTLPALGWGEAQQILKDTTREGLELCTVPFGYVAVRFTGGELRWVTVTEKYRIPEETRQLGRIFLPIYPRLAAGPLQPGALVGTAEQLG
jgi:hypothetical protein